MLWGDEGTVAGNLIGLNRAGTRSLEGGLQKNSDEFPNLYAPHDQYLNPFGTVGAGVVHYWSEAGTSIVVGGPVIADANVISGFPVGVEFDVGDDARQAPCNCLVEHDLIGTNAAGTAAIGNIYGVDGARAGGAGSGRVLDSVVSGNHHGVVGVQEVSGSRIGTNADGTAALPNSAWGVVSAGTVGGARAAGSDSCSAPCNLISGNGRGAVLGARDVEGNFIGTNLLGTTGIPNGGYWRTGAGRAELAGASPVSSAAVTAIHQLGGPSGVMGGHCDRACNLISGNDQPAVQIDGAKQQLEGPELAEIIADKILSAVFGVSAESAPAPAVQGNSIGESIGGVPLANRGAGVVVLPKGGRTAIGGDGGAGNVITDNSGPAVLIDSRGTTGADASEGPTIRGNSTIRNTDGIAYTPVADGPAQPAAPAVVRNGSVLELSGEIAHFYSSKSNTFRVDVYAAASCSPNPQGQYPVGIARTGSITSGWTFTLSTVPQGAKFLMITETGSEAAGSSEVRTTAFSKCVAIPGV